MFEWLIIAWLYVTCLFVMYGIKLNVSGFGHWRWWELVLYPVYVIPAVLIGMVSGLKKKQAERLLVAELHARAYGYVLCC